MSRAKSAGTTDKTLKAERRSAWWKRYKDSLRYSLHVITHPFDGFWDLIHEKRGTIAAANTFVALFLITYVIRIMYTNFQFMKAELQDINVPEIMGSLLLPFLILCLANWAMTTLFEGKGRFKDIYMAMSYALVPYILINLPMVFVSNMLTLEEGSLYSVLLSFALIWCALLVFVGLMEIHDYGPGKTFIFIIVTIFGAAVIIFLVLVFFSLLSDAVSFFVSIYREIVYRMN
uniref:NHL repeat containing protein n=1 Tax=uncultured bacterium Contig33 TaxID=1393553 RepID=W0FNF5_9BACT|nr:NHL repeat containing protein [uncultured bacterium Contig33]